jgi:hypothetical protein
MTRIRLASLVERSEEQQARKPGQPFWWELPEDQWHPGAVGLSHEEALDLLNAEAEAEAEDGGDAPWTR